MSRGATFRRILSLLAITAALVALTAVREALSPSADSQPAASNVVAQTARIAPTNAVKRTNAVAPTNAAARAAISAEGWYYDLDRVAAYIRAYGRLPGNYMTKAEAMRLGWIGGTLDVVAPGRTIGGDRFGNYSRKLPRGEWRECDIDTRGRPRGEKRLIYSRDRRIYYTPDHYKTFRKVP